MGTLKPDVREASAEAVIPAAAVFRLPSFPENLLLSGSLAAGRILPELLSRLLAAGWILPELLLSGSLAAGRILSEP